MNSHVLSEIEMLANRVAIIAHGKVVAQGTTMASCGSGCRGEFAVHVSYVVAHDQRGTIELFEASAKDGSPTNVVDLPVTLIA